MTYFIAQNEDGEVAGVTEIQVHYDVHLMYDCDTCGTRIWLGELFGLLRDAQRGGHEWAFCARHMIAGSEGRPVWGSKNWDSAWAHVDLIIDAQEEAAR